MLTVFKNSKQIIGTHIPTAPLRGASLAQLPTQSDANIWVENGIITHIGADNIPENAEIIDCSRKFIMPTWVDSHTHIVYAGSREDEFVQKLQGKTYAEIAANGGGILNSAAKLQKANVQDLVDTAAQRLDDLIALGTGAIEIKTGYGLTIDAELKMLEVIATLKQQYDIPIKVTLLAAHAVAKEYNGDAQAYIEAVALPLISEVGVQKLADYVDVFCEKGFFSPQQMEQIILAAAPYNIKPKVHINQLNSIGALQKAIELGAISVDHLETMTEQDITDLAQSNTIGTLLPTAAYFLRMPYQPARQLIDAGAAIALASDYNPGSSPSGNMNTVVSMACIGMKMLPTEAINAATINAAFALNLENEVGSIAEGKKANFIVTKPIPSLEFMPYAFGTNHINSVYVLGKKAGS